MDENKKSELDVHYYDKSSFQRKKIILFFLKLFLLWMPLLISSLLFITITAAGLYLSEDRVNNLIVSIFDNVSNGRITLDVDEFSLMKGLTFNNIIIYSDKKNFNKIIEIKKIKLIYELLPMLMGDIKIHEAGIYHPRVYLEEKDKNWNIVKLFDTGGEKLVEQEEEGDSQPLEDISFPISLELFCKLILMDLRVYVKSPGFSSSLIGLSYKADIILPPTKQIPLSVKALSLFQKVDMELNPLEEIDISFFSKKVQVKPPLILTWKLYMDKKGSKFSQFKSTFKFGTHKTPVNFKGIRLAPLNFMIKYDVFYNPDKDHLKLNHLDVIFKNKKWISMEGNISKLTSTPYVKMEMKESSISLNDIYPYFYSITKKRRVKFNGNISFEKLNVEGNPSNLKVNGKMLFNNLSFNSRNFKFEIDRINFSYDIAKIFDKAQISAILDVPEFVYIFKGNKSGSNGLKMKADLMAVNNFKTINITKLIINHINPVEKQNVLDISIKGFSNLRPSIYGSVSMDKFRFYKKPLITTLPEKYHRNIDKIKIYNPVHAFLKLNFKIQKVLKNFDLWANFNIPDYELNDLTLSSQVSHNKQSKKINIKKFEITSKQWKLLASLNGMLERKEKPFSDSGLNLYVKADYNKMTKIRKEWNLKGLFELKAFIKGSIKNGMASGLIKFNNFNVTNVDKKIKVEDFNLKFPYNYFFKSKYSGKSLIAISKEVLIDDEFFVSKPNFTIKSLEFRHPARNLQFEYLKDFTASMSFKNNVFLLSSMKAYALDGSIYGRNILLNLANLDLKNFTKDKIQNNIEFNMIIDATNIDIGKLDDPDPKKKTRSAEFSMNANFSGKGINYNKDINWRGYVNIHKLGEKFAHKLMKGLSTEKGKSKLGKIGQYTVDNSMKIKGFNFNLDKGNVYTKVTMERKALTILSVKDNAVEFERIPVKNIVEMIKGML